MEWAHKWGSLIETGYYNHLLAKGSIKEEDLEPDVGPFQFYLDAFRELSSCRNNSMSLGAIPFTAIVEYSKLFDVGDLEEFHYIIRAMDNRLLSLEFQKSNSGKNGAKDNGPNNASKANSNQR